MTSPGDMSTSSLLRAETGFRLGGTVAATNAAVAAAAAAPELAAAAVGTCHAEHHYLTMDQSLPVLIALCRGIIDEEGEQLLNLDAEPWCSFRPARIIKPKAKDYMREIERRWNTFLRPPQNAGVGPRPASWPHAQLVDWLDKHPIVDAVEVAYLTAKVQEAKAAVMEANLLRMGDASYNDASGEPVIEIDADANDGGTAAQAPSRSPGRAINNGGRKPPSTPAPVVNNTTPRTSTNNFKGLSESIKWLGTSVLASAKLFATQKEKDREMTIAENEKDRLAQLELAKLEAEKRDKEIAEERSRERIHILRSQIDSLRNDKRQLTLEMLSDSNKRSKTIEDFLAKEIEQMTKETQEKEIELNNLLH